jgi:hypothetical protein
MSPIHVTLRLALVSLAIVASSAGAQQDERGSDRRARERADSRTEPVTLRTEIEFTTLIETPQLPSTQCEAIATTDYSQRNTIARVESTIEVADCTKASGELTVAVRVRDESGEIKPLEFNGTWQRSDDQDVSFTTDYPIGENVELMSVRVRGLRCRCADPPPAPAPAPAEN